MLEAVRRRLARGGLERLIRELELTVNGKPFEPTRYQREFMVEALSRAGKIAVVSTTRAGKSTSTAMTAVMMAFLYPNEDVAVVAPTFRQAGVIFEKIHSAVTGSAPLTRMAVRIRRDLIEFANGSRLMTLGVSNPDATLGHGASVLIVDEAASIPDEVWRTRILRMVMAPRNGLNPVVILLSTPHAMNWFYEAVHSGEYKVFRWTWRDAVEAGLIKREEVEYARRVLSDAEFRIWYEAEFTKPEDKLFDLAEVRRVATLRRVRREAVHMPGARYYAGLDVARMGSDENALVIIEVPEGFTPDSGTVEVVAYYTRSKVKLSEVIGWAMRIIEEWRPEAVGVDCIGMGVGVADVLSERLGGLVRCVEASGRARVEMYTLLRRLIREGRIALPRDWKFISQFDSYEVRYTSDGRVRILKRPGMRDDLVDALAYAVYVAAKAPINVVYDARVHELIEEWLGL